MTVFGLLPVVREIYIRENIDLVHGHAVSQIKLSLHWTTHMVRHELWVLSIYGVFESSKLAKDNP